MTVSVAGDTRQARRIAENYRSVGGDLGERLEIRGRTVYLWDRPAVADAAADDVRLHLLSRGVRFTAVTAVLFTCAGQRVDIVSAFGRAGATTIATDADSMAPALYHADAFALVPRVDSPGYVPALAALVAEHDVKLIVPLTDLDQMLLAQSRAALAPALVLVPDPDVCRTMGDKYEAHLFFEAKGIASPRSWLPEDVPDGRALPAPRQGARGLRLATHLSRS